MDESIVTLVRHFGAAALPVVLSELEVKPDSSRLRRVRALRLLEILGPRARPALPSLTAFADDSAFGKEVAATMARLRETLPPLSVGG